MIIGASMSSKFKGPPPNPAKFGKTVTPSQPQNTNKLTPQFSFEYMVRGSGYSVSCCNDEHRSALLGKLFILSQMTWQEIQNAPRHGLGSEKISRSSFNTALPASIPEDAEIIALRYHGKAPVIGFRGDRIFYIVLMDHNFTAYDHG